jgi:hypothetical protein
MTFLWAYSTVTQKNTPNDDTPRTSSNRLSARPSRKPADGLTLKPSPLATASIDSNQSREAKRQKIIRSHGTHQLITHPAHPKEFFGNCDKQAVKGVNLGVVSIQQP